MLYSEEIHERHLPLIQEFQCNDEPDVKSYLIHDALSNHENNLIRTRLFFDEEDNLIGFISLYNDMLTIGKSKRKKHNLAYLPSLKFYPAIKLHYIGVDSRFRKRGYGKALLISVFRYSKEISNLSGCIFLNLESLPNAVSFYEKFEFQRLSRNGIYMNMFFKLSEI